jgi:hypothetical protein
MAGPEGIVTDFWEMGLKGTDHSLITKSLPILGGTAGASYSPVPSDGNVTRAPHVVTLVDDASEDRRRADHIQHWYLGAERKPLP